MNVFVYGLVYIGITLLELGLGASLVTQGIAMEGTQIAMCGGGGLILGTGVARLRRLWRVI